MADPKKFKPYYIVEAFSPKTNKMRQLILATETGRMNKLANLDTAKKRSAEFANSLNEARTLGTSDWKPMIHLQYTEHSKMLVNID